MVTGQGTARARSQTMVALMLLVVLAGLALSACGGNSSTEATANSPSATPSAGASGPGQQDKLVWKFETGAAISSTPAVSQGVVYVGDDDGLLYAVDIQRGQQRWQFTTGGAIRSALAVADGAVYCRSVDGYLHAVDIRSGQERWKFEAGDLAESSPAVGGGRVYLAIPSTSEPHWDDLYALDGASGRVVWKATVTWKVREGDARDFATTSPTVSGGVVYYGAWNTLYALDGKTGERLWKADPGPMLIGTPAVAHGLLYTRVLNNWPFTRVNAVDAKSGERRRSLRTFGELVRFTSPAARGGVVYYAGGDGTLFALDGQSGREQWSSRKGLGGGASSPAVRGGVVCVGNDHGWLHALDVDTGHKAWRYSTGAGVLSSPVIANGVVYVGSDDGYLYAVKE